MDRPGSRVSAARATRAATAPELPAGVDLPEPQLRVRSPDPDPVQTVSEPERAAVVVEASLDPGPSTNVDNEAPPVEDEPSAHEDEPALLATMPEPVVEPVELLEAPIEHKATAEPSGVVLPRGVEISLRLEQDLSTRDNTPGDAFYAHVTDDVMDNSGMVLVPLGARVRGRVVESRKSNSGDAPATLELAMESLIENGRNYPLVATVVQTEIDAETGVSTGRTVAKIGMSVAAGAILGKLLGKDTESAVTGAVIGAAAGTTQALTSKDGHATIAAGSTMVIRLDLPIELEPN